MTKARIYIVRDTETEDTPRLVRAISQSQAVKHVTRPFVASVATQDQLVQLLSENVEVEDAGAVGGTQS